MSSSVTSSCSPVFLSINCLSGNFRGGHTSNFAYRTQSGVIGTCATLAAQPVTYSGDSDLYTMSIYSNMFPNSDLKNPKKIVGLIHAYGSMRGQSHSQRYFHLYGDPMTQLSIFSGSTLVKQNAAPVEMKSPIIISQTGMRISNENVPGSLSIFDIQGRAIITRDLSNQNNIVEVPFNKFSAGMYFYRLHTENQIFTNFFMIK